MARLTHALQRFNWLPNLVLLFTVCMLAYWAADRRDVFELKNYLLTVGVRGGYAHLDGEAERNLSRGCEVYYSRYMFDSQGYRWDLTGMLHMSAEAVAQMDREAPGRLRLTVPIPDGAALGPAKVVTMLTYTCNPVHRIWPVNQVLVIPITII
jgi:hypothetical protein